VLPSCFLFSLPRSGPQYWLYRDDATMAESGICPFSIPRGEAHSIFGISNPVHEEEEDHIRPTPVYRLCK